MLLTLGLFGLHPHPILSTPRSSKPLIHVSMLLYIHKIVHKMSNSNFSCIVQIEGRQQATESRKKMGKLTGWSSMAGVGGIGTVEVGDRFSGDHSKGLWL